MSASVKPSRSSKPGKCGRTNDTSALVHQCHAAATQNATLRDSRTRLVQRDGRQIVLGGLEEGRGAVVRQQDGRTIGAEQGPEIEARVEVRRFRKYAGNVFRTHLPDVANLARAEM